MSNMKYILTILAALICITASAQRDRIYLWQLKYAQGAGYVPYSKVSGEYEPTLLESLISGVAIDEAFIENDTLYFIFSSGDTLNAGYLPLDANTIDTAYVATDSLYIVTTNLDTINAGYVRGPAGAAGSNGNDGADGIGIDTVYISSDSLYVVLTNLDTLNAGYIPGASGGDNWGSQSVVSDNTLTGNGTSENALKVDTTIIATQSYVIGQGYTTNTGTVTSVGGTGTVNGITLTGTVTTSGNLTLGGTLTGVNLTSQVTGTLPVGNGGTGAATLTGVTIGNGTSAITAITGTASQLLRRNAGNTAYEFFTLSSSDIPDISATYYLASNPAGYTTNAGTVTSVGLSLPSFITVSNSPVTTSGTLTGTLATQNANIVFAGPTTGSAAAPTFRSLVSDDIPNLDMAKITAGNLGWSRVASTPTTLSGYGITDAVANTRNINTSGSLTGGGDLSADRTLSLVNDNATPGNTKYYGTDGSGTKGYFAVPGAAGGEANTASNLGSGDTIFYQKSGVDLEFKSLVAGSGMEFTPSASEIEIKKLNVLTPFDTTATAYTLALVDMDRRTCFSSGSDVIVTIPLNATVAFPVGTILTFTRHGAGELDVAVIGGVTLNSADGYRSCNKRYQTLELWQKATDEWILIGDLKS